MPEATIKETTWYALTAEEAAAKLQVDPAKGCTAAGRRGHQILPALSRGIGRICCRFSP
jgi:hypothetical protein